MIKMKKILVTTDLSDASLSAMDYALWLAKTDRAEIYLLYCVDTIPIVAYHTVDLTVDQFRNHILEDEKNNLNRLAEKIQKQSKKKITTVLLEGNAAHSIVYFAKDNDIDIIVMSTHGRTGLQHVLIGSVTEKVVRTAACPVLTVKSTSFQKLKRPVKKK
ncbi:MAG: universal stress protein [Bacteroidetes bacterium]|nr:universal stress protein [Bacteroidota bacterium]